MAALAAGVALGVRVELVILGLSGGVNGVDQLRLDVVPDLSMGVGRSSAFSHVVPDFF